MKTKKEFTVESELKDNLTELFRTLKHASLVDAHKVAPDLQPASLSVLRHLKRTPGSTVGAMSKLFGIDKAAVSRHVHQLEQHGLLIRSVAEQDTRCHLLHLTKRGESLIDKFLILENARWKQRLDILTEDEQETLSTLIEKLI